MKNTKIVQIFRNQTTGGLYGLDEKGDVWFSHKPEGKPICWSIFVKNEEPRGLTE